MKITKIKNTDYYKFYSQYLATNGKTKIRLGQAFLNKFFPKTANSELFYEKDDEIADKIIRKTFLEF